MSSRDSLSNKPQLSSDAESTTSAPNPTTSGSKNNQNPRPVQMPASLNEARMCSAPNSENGEGSELSENGTIATEKATCAGSQFKPSKEDKQKLAADKKKILRENPEFSKKKLDDDAEPCVPCDTKVSK